GVWRWSFAGWQKLSALDVFGFAVSDGDTFLGRFDTGNVGTWRWTPTQGWSLLTGNRPDYLLTDAAGDLVGMFKSDIAAGQEGTWRWSPTTGWARLSTTEPRGISVSYNGAIFENRGAGGIWRAAPGAASFQQIDAADTTNDLLFALPDGSLYLHEWPGKV